MKLEKAFLLDKLTLLAAPIKRFRFILVFIAFSIMYAYIIMQVNTISLRQPSDKQIKDKVTATPQTKLDPNLTEQLNTLEETNIDIKAIFNDARKNPFAE